MSTINKRNGQGFNSEQWLTISRASSQVGKALCYLSDEVNIEHNEAMALIGKTCNGQAVDVCLDCRVMTVGLKGCGFTVKTWSDGYV